MKCTCFIFGFLLLTTVVIGQSSKKIEVSVYGMYARHFKTDYVLDSGSVNLIGRKMNISYQFGTELTYSINKRFSVVSGLNAHLLFVGEIGYGVTGPYPSYIDTDDYRQRMATVVRGLEYVDRISVSIPFRPKYTFLRIDRWRLSIAAGPSFAIYFPTREDFARKFVVNEPSPGLPIMYQVYGIERKFNPEKKFSNTRFSKPQVEWDFDLGASRSFKKKGGITFGLKARVGAKDLERGQYTVWPNDPPYRSKGHYAFNRSYIGVYAGYTFAKTK